MTSNLQDSQFFDINCDLDLNQQGHDLSQKYVNLWRAVIREALVDARNRSFKPRKHSHKIKASKWLKGHSNDFKLVCQLANLDPTDVKERFKKIMQC